MSSSITMKHRTCAVFLLSAVSMVGCLMWWERFSINGEPSTVTSQNEDSSVENPPPFLFQSSWFNDDDANFTGDDDNYKQGERIRSKGSRNKKANEKKEGARSISSALKTDSDAPNTEGGKRPEAVWLMSYPNSGTSYTMMMVGRISNKAIASNYGREVTSAGVPNTPLYPGLWSGPYYQPDPRRPLPRDYILVKTHCGGRCVKCGPDQYILTEAEFLNECRRGSGFVEPEPGRKMEEGNSKDYESGDSLPKGYQFVHYDADLVKKAIHLYRNPFHNIVSRFHLERKHWEDHNKKYEVDRYPNDASGFQTWCADLNKIYGPTRSSKESILEPDVVELMQAIPCHGEMYKYVQWHNLTYAVTTHTKKPTLVVHYEDYETKWNETVAEILDFLHLNMEGNQKEFSARHDYDPYFSSVQIEAAKLFVKRIASESVWMQVERYFP